MPEDDFSSLFDDDDEDSDSSQESAKSFSSLDDELDSFIGGEKTTVHEKSDYNDNLYDDISEETSDKTVKTREEIPPEKRRSSQDFEPDMDALLITAQSPLILEGMKHLSSRDFSSGTLQVYSEAVKGIDLYIKILNRNPNNYKKLSQIINQDTDCKEVEKMAMNLYTMTYNDGPVTDDQKIVSFEILREGLNNGLKKVYISKSMSYIKKFFLQSGSLDEYKITQLYQKNDSQLKRDISNVNQLLKYAIKLIKSGKGEIAKGMKGKDLNIYIIKASEILFYYCNISGKLQEAKYFRRIMETHKNYFVIREDS
jgi:hypothetical protein